MDKWLGLIAHELLSPVSATSALSSELPIYDTIQSEAIVSHSHPSRVSTSADRADQADNADNASLPHDKDDDSLLFLPLKPRRVLHLTTKDPKWVDLFLMTFMQQHQEATTNHQGMDDLLFFVRFPHDSNKSLPPVFVKRKTGNTVPRLDDLIAWKETFFLNLISQLVFDMTVSVCQRSSGEGGGSSMQVVHARQRHVYASPNTSRMDKKTADNELAYPLLYFYVNDFEDAFEGTRVTAGQYLCVELCCHMELPQRPRTKSVLFQGAVSYTSLLEVYQAKSTDSIALKAVQSLSRWLLRSSETTADASHYILMRGPKGKGHAQVAIQAAKEDRSQDGLRWREGGTALDLECRMTFVNLPWHCIVRDMLSDALAEAAGS